MMSLNVDVAIFGAGISGLLLCDRLARAGADVVLVEQFGPGGGQTGHSQGILHNGFRYRCQNAPRIALSTLLREASDLWSNDTLFSTGELGGVPLLSSTMVYWARASSEGHANLKRELRAEDRSVVEISPAETLGLSREESDPYAAYRIKEEVLDIPRLVSRLAERLSERLILADWCVGNTVSAQFTRNRLASVICGSRKARSESFHLHAKCFVFCAGSGNAAAAHSLIRSESTENLQQARPLVMSVMTEPMGDLFGHFIRNDGRASVTVTTHSTPQGRFWYIGGDVAKELLDVPINQRARVLVSRCADAGLPIVSPNRIRFVETARFERTSHDGRLPDGPTILRENNCIIAWPTKLVLAPLLLKELAVSVENILR